MTPNMEWAGYNPPALSQVSAGGYLLRRPQAAIVNGANKYLIEPDVRMPTGDPYEILDARYRAEHHNISLMAADAVLSSPREPGNTVHGGGPGPLVMLAGHNLETSHPYQYRDAWVNLVAMGKLPGGRQVSLANPIVPADRWENSMGASYAIRPWDLGGSHQMQTRATWNQGMDDIARAGRGVVADMYSQHAAGMAGGGDYCGCPAGREGTCHP